MRQPEEIQPIWRVIFQVSLDKLLIFPVCILPIFLTIVSEVCRRILAFGFW